MKIIVQPILPEHVRGVSPIELAHRLNTLRHAIAVGLECACILDGKFATLSVADKMQQAIKDTDPSSAKIQPTPI